MGVPSGGIATLVSSKLLAELRAGAPLDALIRQLVDLADSGVSAEQALAMLNDIRAAVVRDQDGEEVEDRVLDLMDLATGFCSPHMRIWKVDPESVTHESSPLRVLNFPPHVRAPDGRWERTWRVKAPAAIPAANEHGDDIDLAVIPISGGANITSRSAAHPSDLQVLKRTFDLFKRIEENAGELTLVQGSPRSWWASFFC